MKKSHTIETITDVLKFAEHINSHHTKFRSFTRHERKVIMKMMNVLNYDVREMKAHALRWVRLGELVHPGDYKRKYPHAYIAFKLMRNSKIKTWRGKLEEEMAKGLTPGLNWLMDNPEEFCRRIDGLFRADRNIVEIAEIVNKLRIMAGKITIKHLFSLYKWFLKRHMPTHRMARGKSIGILEPLSDVAISLTLTTLEEAIKFKIKRTSAIKKVSKIILYFILKAKKNGRTVISS